MTQLLIFIKEKKFDKRLDEFKQNECVICCEDLKKGCAIRKIPVCKHIFHSKCIDNWFKTKIEEAIHKCPLCNAEITIEKIKEAKFKRKEERKQKRKSVIQEKIN